MATPVKMPQLGMTMTEATVVQWLKHEGDAVTKGEPVATIETDKLNTEVDASADGILRRIVASEGTVVPVVGLMAVIGTADEPESAINAVAGGASVSGAASGQRVPERADENLGGPSEPNETPPPILQPAGVAQGEVRASPIAKRLAAEHGIDLSALQGTGPGGRIVEADVRTAAARPASAPVPAASGRSVGTPAAVAEDGFVRASPLARRLAREAGLELIQISGTGPDGRVVERDVLAAVEQRRRVPAPAVPVVMPSVLPGLTRRETIRLDGMRRVIAERMHQSLQQMAQLTLTTEADATALVELRSHLVPAARVFGHRAPTYTDLLVAIVARVLAQHPLLNSTLLGEPGSQEVACWEQVNVGVAVALERGLVVPIVRDVNQKPLQTISQELGEMVERARANQLTVDDLQGGTFTITNLGQMEIDGFTPIVNPPQCAILGVGRIVKKPAVFEDQLAIRQMVTLSLSFDHRIVDGAPAGAFLRDVKRAIEAAQIGEPNNQ